MGSGEAQALDGLERRLRAAIQAPAHEASELLRVIALSPDGFSQKDLQDKADTMRPLVRAVIEAHRGYYCCEDAIPQDIESLAAAHAYISGTSKDAGLTIEGIEETIKCANTYLGLHQDHDLTDDLNRDDFLAGPAEQKVEQYQDYQRVRVLRGRLHHELSTQYAQFSKEDQAKEALARSIEDLERAAHGLVPKDLLFPATRTLARAYIDAGDDEAAMAVLLDIKVNRDSTDVPIPESEEKEAFDTLESLIRKNPDSQLAIISQAYDLMETGDRIETIKDHRRRAEEYRSHIVATEALFRRYPDDLLVIGALGIAYIRSAQTLLQIKQPAQGNEQFQRATRIYSAVITHLESLRPTQEDPGTTGEEDEDEDVDDCMQSSPEEAPPDTPITLAEAYLRRAECYEGLAEIAHVARCAQPDAKEFFALAEDDLNSALADPWSDARTLFTANWDLAEIRYRSGKADHAKQNYLVALIMGSMNGELSPEETKHHTRTARRRIKSILLSQDCVPCKAEFRTYTPVSPKEVLADAKIGMS